MLSPSRTLFLEPFKSAAAEGAVVELKLRLLAGSIPALQKYALEPHLQNVESPLIEHFVGSVTDAEADILRLCRQLRNKVLHADFHAARAKLNELGANTSSGGVQMVAIPVVTLPAITAKIRGIKTGTEGATVADTPDTAAGTVYGWFIEAGAAGDFQKASAVFRDASAIIDRLATREDHPRAAS